jgi:hypothetical protein
LIIIKLKALRGNENDVIKKKYGFVKGEIGGLSQKFQVTSSRDGNVLRMLKNSIFF